MSYDLLNMDVRAGLASLPERHFHTCVTSPPYYGLRNYGVDGQIGLEKTMLAYIDTMVDVCRGIKRVLRDDGTFWLNCGDSYASGKGTCYNPGGNTSSLNVHLKEANVHPLDRGNKSTLSAVGLKPKDLCGIPWRLVLALQQDGWYWRSTICWAKRSPMPESVTDRPTSAWEPIFLLSKNEHYYYDSEAVKQPSTMNPVDWNPDGTQKRDSHVRGEFEGKNDAPGKEGFRKISPTANLRNFWLLSSEPCKDAHFATFPSIIPHRAIAAGSSERGCCPECGAGWKRITSRSEGTDGREEVGERHHNGYAVSRLDHRGKTPSGLLVSNATTGWQPTCACNAGEPVPCRVLEPFAGSGTTLLEAIRMGRDATGIELNPAYCEIIRRRIDKHAPLFAA